MAEVRATEGNDGIGAPNGPMHTALFEAFSDGGFTPRLHNGRGSAQALGAEFGVAHAVAVLADVVKAFKGIRV